MKLKILSILFLFITISAGFSTAYDLTDPKWTLLFNDSFNRANSNDIGADWLVSEVGASDIAINTNVLRLTYSGSPSARAGLNLSAHGYYSNNMTMLKISFNLTQSTAVNVRTGWYNSSNFAQTYPENNAKDFAIYQEARTTLKSYNDATAIASIGSGSNNHYDLILNTSNENSSLFLNGVLVQSFIKTAWGVPQDIYSFGVYDMTSQYYIIEDFSFHYYDESVFVDKNISTIFDNSSYHYILFNTTANLLFNALDVNGTNPANWSNSLNFNCSALGKNVNFTAGTAINVLFNSTASNVTAVISNALNSSQNISVIYYPIDEATYLGLIYNNTNILINLINGLNFTIDMSNIDLILNYSQSINNSISQILNNTEQILNLTNMTYEEITFIKKLQICFLQQYESVAEYYYYCEDWNPFNPFRPADIRAQKNNDLDLAVNLLNSSVAEQESIPFNTSACFDTAKYLNRLNTTDYFIVNAFYSGASIFIDFNLCWITWGLKAVSIIK